VVAVFVVLLAMMSGFRLSLGATGGTRNAAAAAPAAATPVGWLRHGRG